MASTCGGERGRRSPLPRLSLLACCLFAAVCGAQLQPPAPPSLDGGSCSNASSRVAGNSLVRLEEATTITGGGALHPTRDDVPGFPAQWIGVVSFNRTVSVNVSYDHDRLRRGEGLVARSLDGGPPPGSHGGFLGISSKTLEAKNGFVLIQLFDTVNRTYDLPVGLDIGGSVESNKTASIADFNVTWIASTEAYYTGVRVEPKPASPVPCEKSRLGLSASTGTDFKLNWILDRTRSIDTIPDKKSNTWMFIVAIVVPAVSVIAVAVTAFFLSNLPGTEKLTRKAAKNFGERQRGRMVAPTCGGRRGRLGLLVCLVACFFFGVVCGALEGTNYINASFQAANSREEKEVVRLKDAVITGGTLPCWNTLHGNAPIVIAQGGFSGLFPDSSDMAYEFAAKWTPDSVLYCDLRLTKDGNGICLPYLDMGNCTTISTLYPLEKKSYVVNGVPTWGWFSVDYTTAQLRHVYRKGITIVLTLRPTAAFE
ncbi:hypothetical protein EJB05_39162, partial [Eragrostis curvula]